MEVIVLEGPAGSGKSTAAEMMEREGIPNLSKDIILPRNHETPVLSYARDMSTIYTILTDETTEKIVLERFWFSTLVYDHLRQQGFFSSDIILQHRDNLFNLLNILRQDFSQRGIQIGDVPHFTFIFFLPLPEDLVTRREIAGKEYPFRAETEHQLFTQLRDSLIRRPNSEQRMSVEHGI